MNKKYSYLIVSLLLSVLTIYPSFANNSKGLSKKKSKELYSIETGYTIQKVRTANFKNKTNIIASSYEGTILAIDFDGKKLWENKLSGFMVYDIWCADINGNGNDEILVANADGAVYCINAKGKTLWKHQKNEVPMYAVCTVQKEGTSYVVAGGYDLSVYYLSAKDGSLVKELKSSTYSKAKPWGANKPKAGLHYANFLRPIKKADGTDMLAIHGSSNHMQDKGIIYLFDVLADQPLRDIKITASATIGEFRTSDYNKDGIPEILLGISGHQNNVGTVRVDLAKEKSEQYKLKKLGFGYSVTQPELINDQGTDKYLFLTGNHISLVATNFSSKSEEKLETKFSYNDIWKVPGTNQLVLASAQSGGSEIHVIDTEKSGWKSAYEALKPKGKIEQIIDNTAKIRKDLENYKKPKSERDPLPVYFMTSQTKNGVAKKTADEIKSKYQSPVFLGGSHMSQAENWDRSAMPNEKYKKRKDRRRKYVYSQEQAVDHITKWYKGEPGIAYWGGHGNDPYMFQLSTTKKIIDYADGKKTVLIYPELEDHTKDFAWVMDDLFYPLAKYAQGKNANIFVRTKHNFWQGNIYLPMWEPVMDGGFSEVFVPSMEETTDKAMDISIAGRAGVWASGAFNSWGTRAVPDNPSFDRSRQFSNQRLPNHFLRHLVFHMANGAQYINNLAVDSDYISVLWELVAKGALYVPKPNEIVSFSPVHLSMMTPDHEFIERGSNAKWSTFYEESKESYFDNFVFSRQNGTWPAAKVTPWDFSSYAGNVKDRRQNFLPNYSNGLVLITPPQAGTSASKTAKRKPLKENLNPIYKNILKEYYTDGHYYYSADGTQKYNANEYYKTIEKDIKESANKLPLTVTGDVAWVVAQTSPTNLRLTLIDGGYLNPSDKVATVKLHTIQPKSMTDILNGETFDTNKSEIKIEIPCGAFRFIDIELKKSL
ncbi:hypothetical protein FHR24_001263 [Wenyingzhuangia heitensis]|uniref:Uncharacterized protein n=1 Tax=Wenyingzhuangia heitensis TaxID=1487859 RepID=A0ABX0U7K2_9FLAO|nr:PQQ-binding-like beta-propeller repeat protein [Wenyingzhuangia heitensis]NIJ44824.1 hypothetical protein [Wenyingzhuangia heitensis]